MKRYIQLLFFLFLVVGTIWILRRGQTAYVKNEGAIFGTTYHITYQSPTDYHPQLQAEMQRVDNALSLFNKNSWLSRYNRGDHPSANILANEVIKKAMVISRQTDGAFDITVAPLVNAWGFGYKQGQWPTESEIDSLLQIVGYERYLQGKQVQLDCGAIAKGYSVDRVANVLRQHGVKNFMVEIGGEVVVEGHNPDGKVWNIGVARPTDEDTEIQEILSLNNAALATSGNYRNYHTDSLGHKVAHTINPRSGRPGQQNLLSATVKASNCTEADAYATAFMVMGLDKTIDFVKQHSELQVYLIYSQDDGSYGIYNTFCQ